MKTDTPASVQTTAVEQPSGPSRIWELLAWISVLALLAYLIFAISDTMNWQLFHDAPIMHYIAWLMTQGLVPYRDIFDINMPGTYLIHLGVIKTLGDGSEAWRIFDLSWLGVTCLLIIMYCKRQGFLAGLTAATLFACFHVSSGEIMAGQRDFLLAPLLLLGGHFVANVTENKMRLLAALLAGLMLGAAFWIKPHVILFFIVIFLYAKIQSQSIFVSLLMLLGFLIPAGGVFTYLYLNGALLPWWEIVSQYLIPIFSFLGPDITSQELIFTMLSSLAVLLPFLALSTPLTGRFFVSLIGVIYGVAHFLLQKKGFTYHLSPLFLWASIFAAYRIGSNIKAPKIAPRFAALIGIMTVCILASPLYLLDPKKLLPTSPAVDKTEAIYSELQGITKAGEKIQVMDHTSGAVHALLKLKAKPATRFIRDFEFFSSTGNYYVQKLEDEFIASLTADKPRIIVVTKDSWPDPERGFDRLNDSPALMDLLNNNYDLYSDQPYHRIYVIK